MIQKTTTIKAASFSGNTRLAGPVRKEVMVHKALLCPVTLRNPYTRYSGGGRFALTDGTRGTLAYGDGSWQGYQENNLDAVIDLGDTITVHRLAIRTLENTPSWIFHPVSVEFSVSCDGVVFSPVGMIERPMAAGHQPFTALEWDLTIRRTQARYIRVVAQNVGLCPPWHGGKGKPAWLFADEIVVE
jgi:hypothetical protein